MAEQLPKHLCRLCSSLDPFSLYFSLLHLLRRLLASSSQKLCWMFLALGSLLSYCRPRCHFHPLSLSRTILLFSIRAHFTLIYFRYPQKTITGLSLFLWLQAMEFPSSQTMNEPSFKQDFIQDKRDPHSSTQDILTRGAFDIEVNPSKIHLNPEKLCFYGG